MIGKISVKHLVNLVTVVFPYASLLRICMASIMKHFFLCSPKYSHRVNLLFCVLFHKSKLLLIN